MCLSAPSAPWPPKTLYLSVKDALHKKSLLLQNGALRPVCADEVRSIKVKARSAMHDLSDGVS